MGGPIGGAQTGASGALEQVGRRGPTLVAVGHGPGSPCSGDPVTAGAATAPAVVRLWPQPAAEAEARACAGIPVRADNRAMQTRAIAATVASGVRPPANRRLRRVIPPPSPIPAPTPHQTVSLGRFTMGTKVPDPYRWLEDTTDNSPETKAWVRRRRSSSTFGYLETPPLRAPLKARLTAPRGIRALWRPLGDRAATTSARAANDGLQNQSVLYVADSLDATPRALLDPNTRSPPTARSRSRVTPSPTTARRWPTGSPVWLRLGGMEGPRCRHRQDTGDVLEVGEVLRPAPGRRTAAASSIPVTTSPPRRPNSPR
jgi:hypothetical protein